SNASGCPPWVVWMGMVGCGRAVGARPTMLRRCAFIAAALLGVGLAGCSTTPQAPVAAAAVRGPTVAFESIAGPPASVFRRLGQDLSEEAAARQVAVVSRDGQAQFRVHGYLAALVEGRRRTTVIAWVWDVYDAEQHRLLRISGEEPASSGQGTWAA